MKLETKVYETPTEERRDFRIGLGAGLGINLPLAALVMYVTLVHPPRGPREPGFVINPEIPLAIVVVVINLVGLTVLARYRHQVYRGALIALWVAVGLTLCFGCSFIGWMFFMEFWWGW